MIKQAQNQTSHEYCDIVRLSDSDSEVEQLPNQVRHREFDISIVDNLF